VGALKLQLFPGIRAGSISEFKKLWELYIVRDWSAEQIANKCAVSERSVYSRLEEFGISKAEGAITDLKKLAKLQNCCAKCGQAL
jgi:predicted DNA-binding protein YlxM (UPF0122 family)